MLARTQKARQFAYIEYEQPSEAQAALALNGQWNDEEHRAWSVAISDPSRRSSRQAKEQGGPHAPPSADEACQLFVSNFPHSTTKEELVQLFSQYGGLCDVRILLDNQGKSKGCGFVEYYTQASAQAALALNAYLMGERHLSVVPADPSKRGRSKRGAAPPDTHLTGVLRVTHLPDTITEQAVRDAFSLHGQVLKIKLFGHGGAMVKYSNDEEANLAVLAMNDLEIMPNHRISVTSARQSALAPATSTASTAITSTATGMVPRHLGGQSHRRRRLPVAPAARKPSTSTVQDDDAKASTATDATERSNEDFRQLFLQSRSKE
ncbi:hypothetical protein SYNPS1DRAFT_30648 [Syncephalis pseudoplumigaleata]|uniref:RRM domain-containing protein n=1 Tax=Syncephalis pseudoplumigaleata TaxID=1712513 RepID=A0A4P9YUA0_9FUNG|nr:hypothetical protein SYNPS1DRAFT_30648 [Syncephalis pseudoplumigaleata]|eukprot:RKP23593.1 hypothetical protein SYNPS1DRAFT_30648 [Syncephalis pseudoplumigaleata]